MNTIKKYSLTIILFILLIIISFNVNKIANVLANLLEKSPTVSISASNEYAKDYDFEFVEFSEDFKPLSYQELKNVFFTVINNGWDSFTFYCPEEYTDCINDVKKISSDDVLLTNINNYTHPFNNYSNIKTTYYENGEVTLAIKKLYSLEKINKINKEVDKILKKIITKDMKDEDKIKAAHDWIINHANYDQEKNNDGVSSYESNTAYGILFQKMGICSGYADLMAIFLTKMDFKNFKVASLTHVWNAVYVNGAYYHLDLTWDDPVSEDGEDNLWHKYFLITKDHFTTLDKPEETDHHYDKNVYPEVK